MGLDRSGLWKTAADVMGIRETDIGAKAPRVF
jgi:hypothetical protein